MIHLYYRNCFSDESKEAKQLLEEVLTRIGIPFSQIHIGFNGKPYLEKGPYYSISHSKGHLVLAISNSPIGVDIELVRKISDLVPIRVLSQNELQWYQSRGQLSEDFIRLWTLKESYYKYLGTGLPGYPNKTSFYFDRIWNLKESSAVFATYQDEKLITSVCSGAEQTIIRHFL